MKRHIGKLANTDQRCVVVFMQIPGKDDHALVVSTDNLQPRLEQAIMDIVESNEGQGSPVLASVLGRRLLPDTGQNVLQLLHDTGLLRAVHIDQVVMYPQPNMPFPLRKIIEGMGGTLPINPEIPPLTDDKYNPHTANLNARSTEEREAIARNLIVEAEMLEAEAAKKRQTAAQFAPQTATPAKATRGKVDAEKVVAENVQKTRRPRKKTEKA